MIKPDLILVWPTGYDYPYYRKYLELNRHRFNDIIIAFNPNPGKYNYEWFIKNELEHIYVKCIHAPHQGQEDWRNIAVNRAYELSQNAEYILFTEQDFYITNEDEWEHIQALMREKTPYIGFKQGDRLHPAFALFNRTYLQGLNLDFSANPPQYDHMGALQKQINTSEVALLSPGTYEHVTGMTDNMARYENKQQLHGNPDLFVKYMRLGLSTGIKLHANYRKIFAGI